MIDWLIVGAGLTGATVARRLADAGKRVLVLEKRERVGGNCADVVEHGYRRNLFGGHIFHTNSARVWEFANRFASFEQYEHRVKARAGLTTYSFPPNAMTYQQLGTDDPEAVHAAFFDGYSRKQWGENPPESALRRIPARTTWDDRYFSDRYQGLPVGGYTSWVASMLDGIDVELNADYLARKCYYNELPLRGVVYTGPVDALFRHHLGRLEYRSLRFVDEWLPDCDDFQGCATVNYCDYDIPWTRILEWKHYGWKSGPGTLITYEYPAADGEPFYPVPDERNRELARKYAEMAARQDWLHVCGRLGSYQYLNMDQAIGQGLAVAERILNG